jgi:hypothetical protein
MLQASSPNPADEFLAFARAWLDLLAKGELAEACAQLDAPNSYGLRWTPSAIHTLVRDSFGPATVFAATHPEGPIVTPTTSATGSPGVTFGALDDGSGFWLDHPVPLNGEWSDLTAQFEFIRQPTGFRVVLHDLHVL